MTSTVPNGSTGARDAAEVIGGLCGTEAVTERLSEPLLNVELH